MTLVRRAEMRQALIISSSLHVLLVIAASMIWPRLFPMIAPPEPVMHVDLVTLSKETAAPNVAKPNEKPVIKEQEEIPPVEIAKVEPMAAPLPPALKLDQAIMPPPAIAPQILPEPTLVPDKPVPKLDMNFKPLPPLPQPKERAKEKPKDKPEKFDISKIATDLNKLEKKSDKPQPQTAMAQAAPKFGERLTASERDALRGMLSKNWNMPAGAPHPENLIVVIRFYLNPNGALAGTPEILNGGQRYLSDPYFRAAADAAVRAVQMTAPFKFLSPDKYPDWREIEVTFDPRDLIHG